MKHSFFVHLRRMRFVREIEKKENMSCINLKIGRRKIIFFSFLNFDLSFYLFL